MLPTYTNEIKKSIISDYLKSNLVILLIYKPGLGLTNAITSIEQEARLNLTMLEASATEVGATQLNGYSRNIVSSLNITDDFSSSLEVTFTADGGNIGPFTHVVAARGADLRNASISNGNNRGNSQGTVIFVEPVINAPLILNDLYTFRYTLKFNISTQII